MIALRSMIAFLSNDRTGIQEGQELDVEILRIAVFREVWQCLTDNDACVVSDAILDRVSLQPAALAGDYNVFDLSAVPVEETDPFTGGGRRQGLAAAHRSDASRD